MNFKNRLMALVMVVMSMGVLATSMDVEARRLGGGRPAGMQRQMPARQPAATPNQAAPNNAIAPAPGVAPGAQPGKRSWMGPIAGIAAGLGIAALMSHFGMGEAMGNFMTMALVAMVAMFAISWLMRRFSGQGPQVAGAGAPMPGRMEQPIQRQAQAYTPPEARVLSPLSPLAQANLSAPQVPVGFDAQGFERIAKMIFIRLQAANDESNIEDIRKFTTPELFASLRVDLQERGGAKQQTDVVQLDVELVDTAQESGQWVASVQFSGLIREEADSGAKPFKELWHLVRPLDESREWAIAGITPIEG
jgi:predicted lipid-binding transport protein (Tim44 family)